MGCGLVEETTSPLNILNTGTLRAAGKFQELTHEMDKYRRNILVLCKKKKKKDERT